MMNPDNPTKQRLVITFGKFEAMRYTSNLDVAKVWERVLRRANLPLLYSKGFNTRPRIQLATALPLGVTSECELLDVALKEVIPIDEVVARLQAVSPQGLRIYEIKEANIYSPALQTLVRSAEYRIRFIDPVDLVSLQHRIDALLGQSTILKAVQRKNRKSSVDLRQLIYELYLDESGNLIAHLAAGEQGSIRAEDILRELDLGEITFTAHRLRLHIEDSK